MVQRLLDNNRHALVELPQLLADAQRAGQLAAVSETVGRSMDRELFVRDLFLAPSILERWRVVGAARRVPLALRARLFVYAACPGLLWPFFALKRLFARAD